MILSQRRHGSYLRAKIDGVRAHVRHQDRGQGEGHRVAPGRVQPPRKERCQATSGTAPHFVTVFRSSHGNFRKGQPVYVLAVRGVEYIKMRDNGRAEDNLDDLPEF